ncbi:hypothetical protein [Kitasatospora purpeofusca]|uniref:hypothetical protein n=1 Tax=Kitasatospora purpeofusca TaxID=67352 RepID=UPI0036894220
MKSLGEVKAAFAKLPARVTIQQIATGTGRTVFGVRNWIADKSLGFPEEDPPPGPRGVKYRLNHKVVEWYEKQSFATAERPTGPGEVAERARIARPRQARMNTRELGHTLGLTDDGVNYYSKTYTPANSEDPFPEIGTDGLRDWPEVREWILRRAEAGRTPSREPERDELGLTPRQREALDIVLEAAQQDQTVSPETLAERLGLKSPDSAARLLRDIEEHVPEGRRWRPSGGRHRPAALADAVGISRDMVKYYAKTFTAANSEDPFPAPDENNTRDEAEVKAWIERRRDAPRRPRGTLTDRT